MLEDLDVVIWDDLEHAYGSAGDLPQKLRALAASDPQTLSELHAGGLGLIHQASVFSASAAAVPFLVEIAISPDVAGRASILRHAVLAAVYEGHGLHRPHGVRRALAGCIDRLVGLLEDADPDIRSLAATGLGHCNPPAEAFGEILDDHRRRESDAVVRAALVASAAACDPTLARGWIREAYQDPADAVRAAAVYATSVNGLPWTWESIHVLCGCWGHGDPLDGVRVWQWSGASWWMTELLDHLPRFTRRETIRALATTGDPAGRLAAAEALGRLREDARLDATATTEELQRLVHDDDPDIQATARRYSSS